MSGAPINEMLNNALRDTVAEWKQNGLSNEEVISKIENINLDDIMMSITDVASTDFSDYFKKQDIELSKSINSKSKFSAFYIRQEIAKILNDSLGIVRCADKLIKGIEEIDYYINMILNKSSNFNTSDENDFIEMLKTNGKIRLYTALVNTRIHEINDMIWEIEFPNGLTSFNEKILQDPANQKELIMPARILRSLEAFSRTF
jgi:hypothetical protein